MFSTHHLPDGPLSVGLEEYLRLLASEYAPVGEDDIKLFAGNVVEQVQKDYSKSAHWGTVVRFKHRTKRQDVNKALDSYRDTLIYPLAEKQHT